MKFSGLAILPLLLLAGCASTTVSSPTAVVWSAAQVAEHKALCAKQTMPSMACADTMTATFDDKGVLWVAWATSEYVFVQSSLDKGKSFMAPVKVNAVAEPVMAHDEYRPKIALDRQGHIFLTWNRSLEKKHTGHIRFSRSMDGGRSFSAPVTVNDNKEVISHRFDSLAVGENGEIFIAWLDARDREQARAAKQEFAGTSLYYTWSADAGQSFYPNQVAASHTCECCRLATAIDENNLPVVAWRHVFPGGIRDHALMRFENWQTPGPVQRMIEDNWKIDACPHHGPSLAIADDGSYHTVWFSGAEQQQGLFYANSFDKGLSYSHQTALGGQTAKHPYVATLGQQVAVAWMEFDGSHTQIKLMQSFDRGISWSEPQLVGSVAGSADYAFLVTDEDDIYLAWQSPQGYLFKAIDDF